MPPSKNKPLASLNLNQSMGGAAEFEAVVNHLLGKIQTISLVLVKGVKATGVSPVGFVDVLPMVKQIDGADNAYDLGVIYNVPYFRLQGGASAVICDPKIGDIGLCGFCSRDISTVKRSKAPSAPNTRRQFAWADGLYIGGFLNGTPSQYIWLHDGGITMLSPGDIDIQGANIRMTASGGVSTTSATFQANTTSTAQFTGGGGISADGDVVAGTISLQNHVTTGVTPGTGNSGKPA